MHKIGIGAGFRPINVAILGAGALSIVWGYFLLNRGSVTGAPIFLVIGYVVLIPLGIAWGIRRPSEEDAETSAGE
ncbi:MAG: hypothetical protein ABFS14_06605 [Gemmatimonadota bacterium]